MMQRAGSSRAHKLTSDMPAPAKQHVPTNTKTRSSWMPCLLMDFLIHISTTMQHKSTLSGYCWCRWCASGDRGVRADRHDLCSSHEEADILITQHAIALGLLGKSVNVVSDDTDVFVLLVHFYNSQFKASNPPCSCYHQWKNEQWLIFVPLQKHIVI